MTLAIRTRLTLTYGVVFGLVLAVTGLFSYRLFATQLDRDTTAHLMELTTGLHGYLRLDDGFPQVVFDEADPEAAEFVRAATTYYRMYDARTGLLLLQSKALASLGVALAPEQVRAAGELPRVQDIRTGAGRFRVADSRLATADRVYLLQVAISLAPMEQALGRFLTLLLAAVSAGLVAAIPMALWMSRLALSPLARLADRARTIGIGDLDVRLPVRGAADEVDDVASAFNQSLERLQRAVGEMRQFSSALAHELRTPLTALRGEIELALRDADASHPAARRLASQLEEIDTLTRLIERLLTLARAEAGQIPLDREVVDLGAVAATLMDQVELVAGARRIVRELHIASEVYVRGDARWLERMLLNLLDNAIKFNREGGRIVVRVLREGSSARLEVHDTGIGIPADALPHVFERFFRADHARAPSAAGAGLGLSLVKWIVERHAGAIEVRSGLDAGTTVCVELPAIEHAMIHT
jgi:heavy metal sensor kinase